MALTVSRLHNLECHQPTMLPLLVCMFRLQCMVITPSDNALKKFMATNMRGHKLSFPPCGLLITVTTAQCRHLVESQFPNDPDNCSMWQAQVLLQFILQFFCLRTEFSTLSCLMCLLLCICHFPHNYLHWYVQFQSVHTITPLLANSSHCSHKLWPADKEFLLKLRPLNS